jgi:hypothetical protein
MPILRILCYNDSLVAWTVASSSRPTPRTRPLLRSCTLLLVARTTLLYNRIHTKGWKPCASRGPVLTPENFQRRGETWPAGAAIQRVGRPPPTHHWSDQSHSHATDWRPTANQLVPEPNPPETHDRRPFPAAIVPMQHLWTANTRS